MTTTDPTDGREPPVDSCPVAVMNWGDDAAADGQYQVQKEDGKTIDNYYYRDADGKLQLQPSYQRQIDNAQIDWWGVGRDLVTIIFGAIGGAGDSVLSAIGVVGGSGAAASASVDDYKKKKKNGEPDN